MLLFVECCAMNESKEKFPTEKSVKREKKEEK